MPNRKYVSLLPRLFSLLLLVICLAGLARPLCAQDAAHSPGWVVISVPDYRALRVKAFPAEREPEPPPTVLTPASLALGHAPLADCGRYDRIRKIA